MTKSFVALTIKVPFDREEDVKGYLLVNYTVEGFEETPGGDMVTFLHEDDFNEAVITAAVGQLGARVVHVERLEHKDWNAAWEASIEPVRVTDELVITPSWKKEEAEALASNHLLIIDPKMSFGTGHHETTRLCLRLIESLDCVNKTVLDVGTGTGALAMYALQRGASHAIGIDIDEWSYENAQENRDRNALDAAQFDIRLGDLASTVERGEQFDLVIANIHRNVLIPLAPTLYSHTAPAGTIILSGILTYDATDVRTAYLEAGFRFDLMLQEQEWVALLLTR